MTEFRHLKAIRESVNAAIDEAFRGKSTAEPGFVEKFYAKEKLADITPIISDFYEGDDGSANEEPRTKLPKVPIWYPGGGGWTITWPLKVGDPVLLVFCQRNIANWFISDGKEPVAPEFSETHPESAAICIPRLFPRGANDGEAHEEYLTIAGHGIKIILKTDGAAVIEGARVELGADGAAQALGLASKQDIINTAFATRLDPIVLMLTGGAFPPMLPVDSIASQKVFASA